MHQLNDTFKMIHQRSAPCLSLPDPPAKCFRPLPALLSPFSPIPSLAPSHRRACLQELQLHGYLLQFSLRSLVLHVH